jgi:hypothetical protein
MTEERTARVLTFEELQKIADLVAFHAPVIVMQRDRNDSKMDERSCFLHKLWIRISTKINISAGGYSNIKEDVTHERVLVKKIKGILDIHLDKSLSDEEYDQFIAQFLQKALKQLERL